jgi:hypothetical protein
MKYLVILAFLISSVLSAPAPQDFEDQPQSSSQAVGNSAQIVRYDFEWYPDGDGYRYT